MKVNVGDESRVSAVAIGERMSSGEPVLCGDVIAQSMQLIAGRTAQEYNQRKEDHGAFWEDRYHATAIGTDEHLHRCIVYIDLNMVRAGVVEHPAQWLASGYREIQKPPKRYAVIDRQALIESCGFTDAKEFQRAHHRWIEEALASELTRAAHWSEAIAVGGLTFVEQVQNELGVQARYHSIERGEPTSILREPSAPYDGNFAGENDALRIENTVLWDESAAIPQSWAGPTRLRELLVRSVSLGRLPVSQSRYWGVSMKQSWLWSVFMLISAVALTGCELVAVIFQAGVWVGVLLVLGIIAIVIWLISKMMR